MWRTIDAESNEPMLNGEWLSPARSHLPSDSTTRTVLTLEDRAYPATEFLHPHGPDVIRGMLEFADGVRLSRAGAGWLAVHGANTLGTWNGKSLTKLTFQERVDTIKGLADLILLAAEDPLGHRWWIEADDPWQFLAFIFEWAQWLKTYNPKTQQGELESHIPVGLDGTANGIQHYSALLARSCSSCCCEHDEDGPASGHICDSCERSDPAVGRTGLQIQLRRLWLASVV